VSSDKNIPSDEDFAKASAALRKRSRGLSQVRDRILERFQTSGKLHEFFILDSSEKSFTAYVFYRWERQIKKAEESGLAIKIKNAIFHELRNAGRGDRETIQLEIEFDSHESVEQYYDGDYYSRLH
jgi:hypothetical protein